MGHELGQKCRCYSSSSRHRYRRQIYWCWCSYRRSRWIWCWYWNCVRFSYHRLCQKPILETTTFLLRHSWFSSLSKQIQRNNTCNRLFFLSLFFSFRSSPSIDKYSHNPLVCLAEKNQTNLFLKKC